MTNATDFRPRVRRRQPKALIRIDGKKDFAIRAMLICGMLSMMLLSYAFGRYQAAQQAQAMVEASR